jgi:hypothetical protein
MWQGSNVWEKQLQTKTAFMMELKEQIKFKECFLPVSSASLVFISLKNLKIKVCAYSYVPLNNF